MSERDIFHAALALTDPTERAAFLAQACAGDPTLHAHVLGLLEVHGQVGSFLEAPAADPYPTFVDLPTEPPGEGPGSVLGPYKLLEPLGEGGMGTVFLAEQHTPLRRQVALKVLKPGMDSRQIVARFEAERQALALMDHPNIAKVFEAGQTAGGRPYFVMELVKGAPMTAYCDDARLALRQRLELFVAVCRAVQHAHQKGIIHRDLKPSNVLVALQDGTAVVKVIDFGIARALGEPLTDKTVFTSFAQLVGTPLYMAPEQAALGHADLDTRCDIYSLGVILYELLTGTTPFDGARLSKVGYDEWLRILREVEPPRPSTRLSTLGAEVTTVATSRRSDPRRLSQLCRGELDWIVMKALEKDRGRRYDTASAFAQDVERYLRDEPVLARPPSAWYQLRKFARRNRRALVTAALLGVLLLAALGAVAGTVGWALRDQTLKVEEANRGARQARADAAKLQRAGNWAAAQAVARQAQDLLAGSGGDEELAHELAELGRDLAMAARVEETRGRKSDVEQSRFAFDRAPREYAQAFRDFGIDVERLDPDEAARRIRERTIALELAAALDDWALTGWAKNKGINARLLAIARAADPDPWRNRVRAALERDDRQALKDLAASADVDRLPPPTLTLLWMVVDHVDTKGALDLLRRGATQHPGDYWVNHYLGIVCWWRRDSGLHAEAIRYLSVARALRPQSAAANNNLGAALDMAGRTTEAEVALRRALEIDAKYSLAWSNLGGVLSDQGRPDEAEAALRKALRFEPELAGARVNLASLLTDQDRWAEAEAECRKALKSKHERDRRTVAKAYAVLRNILWHKGRFAEAVEECRQARDADPGSAAAHVNLGAALDWQGNLAEAERVLRHALKLWPNNASARAKLGRVLDKQRRWAEAEIECCKAIRLNEGLAAAHGSLGVILGHQGKSADAEKELGRAITLRPSHAAFHRNLAVALLQQQKYEAAEAALREAVRLRPAFAEAHIILGNVLVCQRKLEAAAAAYRKALELRPGEPDAHCGLGDVLRTQGKPAAAEREYRKALDVSPGHAHARRRLGVALADQGKFAAAEREYRKAVMLRPADPDLHIDLGMALGKQGKVAEAVAEYHEALKLKPDHALAHYNLGVTLYGQGKLREAEAAFQAALRLKPDYAEALVGLGLTLQRQGRLSEAVGPLRRGHELGSRGPKWCYPSSAQWVRQAEQLAALDGKLSKILRDQARPGGAAESMELARLCQDHKKCYAAAVRFYAAAFAAEPTLAEDRKIPDRYNAACAAALAAAGQGKDAADLDDRERARLRQQALAWLRADLATWTDFLAREPELSGEAVRRALRHWQRDTDFDRLRGDALAELPEVEQQLWRELWADVERTLRNATPKAPAPPTEQASH
jgi:serine/threonine protein kinase/Flp pilus assembly protein TadD